MAKITLADIHAGRLRENGHLNYGPNGSGYPMQHTTIARLSCIDRHYKGPALKKAGVASARLWCVDGEEVASLEEAIERLNVPPVFTEDEAAALERVPVEWVELRPFREKLAGQLGRAVGVDLHMLRQKGAIEIERRGLTSFIRRAPEQVEAQS